MQSSREEYQVLVVIMGRNGKHLGDLSELLLAESAFKLALK